MKLKCHCLCMLYRAFIPVSNSYKNRPKNARVIDENKWFIFFTKHGVVLVLKVQQPMNETARLLPT